MTSLFPVLHWFGFMGLGFWFGSITHGRELSCHASKLLPTGLILIVTGLLVRVSNGFGNRIHWRGPIFGSEFFVLSKYPPSLVYTLVTLGAVAALLALAIRFESALSSRYARPLITFGQTSLFFYLTHLILYGSVAYHMDRNVHAGIHQTWSAWLIGLVPLYFLCSGYRQLKARRSWSILRYI
jgi:uncharacterized membrane protein